MEAMVRIWTHFPLVALLLGFCQTIGADRSFSGLYTIVNAATRRKLVADTQGFYTATSDAIPKTHLWRIIADENSTHLIQNAALGVRMYAQVGLDREQGFFVIGSDTPVYRDQRWQIRWHELGEGYSITNLKSQRAVSDGSDGLMATLEVQSGSFWWLISQERDEIGLELAKLQCQLEETRHLVNATEQAFERSQFGSPEAALWNSWFGFRDKVMAFGLFSLAVWSLCSLFFCSRSARSELGHFKYQTYKTSKTQDGSCIEQVIRVECPGVRHEDVQVKLIPNGCDVTLHRRPLPGLQEVWWKHRFHLSLSDGFFEFVEEQMQLEHGFLILVLRELRQDRTIRFAKNSSVRFQHFCMDAFDDQLNWDYPADTFASQSSPDREHKDGFTSTHDDCMEIRSSGSTAGSSKSTSLP